MSAAAATTTSSSSFDQPIKKSRMLLEVQPPPSPTLVSIHTIEKPTNELVTPLLTDFYQLTMVLAYWKANRHNDLAIFEAFFRKNPFKGEFTVFAGLTEVIRLLSNFKFTEEDISYLKQKYPASTPKEFFDYLKTLDCSKLTVLAIKEGTVVFPRTPLVQIQGPLALCQLLETTLLNLLNFPSLIATNATRMRMAAGDNKVLLEFGLRRAQGPDGAMTASRYSIIGGFDGTSNVAAGKEFDIDIRGTHAHAFVTSFESPDQLVDKTFGGKCVDFWKLVMEKRKRMPYRLYNIGELVAFVAYAQAFPDAFNALVDTYDTLNSGVPNFLAVAVAMHELGYKARGIRLDSGDLSSLSLKTKQMYKAVGELFGIDLSYLTVVASNDINEATLLSLNEKGHAVDSFGIGTNLVTCQAQPALGMVYKLAEVNSHPVMKLSDELNKVTIPGRKRLFRLFGKDGIALCDLMMLPHENPPKTGEAIVCMNPYDEQKRACVTPSEVLDLLCTVFIGPKQQAIKELSVLEIKQIAKQQLAKISSEHTKLSHPAEYRVMVSTELFMFMHDMWRNKAAMVEMQ
jgi:nicotinate phosphoribosyltransferase